MANASLHAAKDAKNDEFYTRLEDINEEMNHYEDKFRGKVVFCNCDDPKWSNFWKYFHSEFERLGLKKLITTHFESDNSQSYKIEYTGGNDTDFEDGIITLLQGNGDFRSPECLALLDASDIVVTNPPFSLFKEYVPLLIEHNKSFIILGNKNAITYKEIFPLIKDDKLWMGYTPMGRDFLFTVPKDMEQSLISKSKSGSAYRVIDGIVYARAQACWFTNVDHQRRHNFVETTYYYSKRDTLYPELYPKFDNIDAINVNKVSEIPMDYEGIMGVPITFMDKYNPEQFEIVGKINNGQPEPFDLAKPIIDGSFVYKRIAIRRKAGVNNG